ncbi:AraC family transcriptional regulator [Fibrella sp. HMF5335]|uniref:AraC family transcriptional regulator n=1 Tax=Fibrella rubiginis TaxID=2817060 RepID=A0A939GH36_9BACT|nr:AraC family transcriptional regulator [Fibrella rubiginis]MBO0936651.1 AraC family transcriptional regulator [Fibrella rubiginis]
MKALEISLIKDSNQSFTFYHEKNPFSRWHYHPEYELVLIHKGTGKRMVGDSIDRFDEGDLVFVGSNLPHEWLCDDHFFSPPAQFAGEGIVIQFTENFLGDKFFKLHENKRLRKMLDSSTQGCMLTGKTKETITELMLKMISMDAEDRFYTLFTIFRLLSKTKEYTLLASPNFTVSFQADGGNSIRKVIEYIMQHFHEKIQMKKMLELANMSSTTFSVYFKKTYNMTFQEYVLKVRIGYACSLLTDNNLSIAQIALQAGFDNLSNFNRLFKKVKGNTPKEFRKKALENERFDDYYV